MWRGEVRRGRAGQAFDFGEPGVLDGATAKSLAAGTCRHLGLDAAAYLRDVLPALHALGDKPSPEQLDPLLSDVWAKRQQSRLIAA